MGIFEKKSTIVTRIEKLEREGRRNHKRIICKRLGFCRKYSKDNQISKKILFTDEKTFNLSSKLHRGDKFRAPYNQRKAYVDNGIKFSTKYLKVAAGISVFPLRDRLAQRIGHGDDWHGEACRCCAASFRAVVEQPAREVAGRHVID